MAVQAQYPSNLLFLNGNLQEEKGRIGGDYAYNQQSRAGEGFVDQPHMIFPDGEEGNPRKRAREIGANPSSPISTFSIQPRPSQFIDLRLAFGEQRRRQQQQSTTSQSPLFCSVSSDDLAAQIRNQREEIEQFLHNQGEQLRLAIAEKRQRHCRALLVAAEESVSRRLREKEVEAGKAAQRNAELQAQAARLSAEARAWQARAKAGEAAAAALQAQLQQAVMGGGACAHDATAMSGDAGAEDSESAYVDPDRAVAVNTNGYGGVTCKACRKRVASVIILPCKHLSLCNDCDRSVTNQRCPACFSYKESSMEVYFS